MNEEFVMLLCDKLDGKPIHDCIESIVRMMKMAFTLYANDNDKLNTYLHTLADLIGALSVIQASMYANNMQRIDDEIKVLRNAISVLQDNA